MVPEDRQRGGLIQSLSVQDNLTLSSLGSPLQVPATSLLPGNGPPPNVWRRNSR